MNRLETLNGTISEELIELRRSPYWWIDDLRHTLADICARGEWDDFGLFRFLNRVSFVARDHLLLVIVREDAQTLRSVGSDSNPLILEKHMSAIDAVFQKPFVSYLEEDGFVKRRLPGSDERIVFERDRISPYLIRLLGTHFFLVLFHLGVSEAEPGDQPGFVFTPIEKKPLGSEEDEFQFGQLFEEVFRPFDGVDGRAPIDTPVEAARYFNRLSVQASGLIATGDAPGPVSRQTLGVVERASEVVLEMVDAEYQRMKKSPLLISFLKTEEGSPTNIFYFGKVFCRESMRYGEYKYNSVLWLGQQQRQDLRAALENVERNELIPYGIDRYDEYFWDTLGSSGGVEQILEEAVAPLPSSIRLFVENALMSGSTMIKPGLFERGGIGWIDKNGLSEEEIDVAFNRIVALHYILQLGAREAPGRQTQDIQKNISLIALPMRCSGGIWMTATLVRECPEGRIPGIINDPCLEQQFLIYHSLIKQSERRFRTKSKILYQSLVAEMIAKNSYSQGKNTGENFPLTADTVVALNRDTHDLCRVFPFERFQVDKNGGEAIGLLEIVIEMDANPFFDRLQLESDLLKDGSYLKDDTDIAREVISRVLLYARREDYAYAS